MSENKHNAFDKFIKTQMDEFEAPFDASDWNAIQQKINAPKATTNLSGVAKKIALFVFVGIAIVASFFFIGEKENQTETSNVKVVEKQETPKEITQPEVKEPNKQLIENKAIETAAEQTKPLTKEVKANTNVEPESAKPKMPVADESTIKHAVQNHEAEPKREINILTSSTEICAYETIELKPTDSMAFKSISWSFGDGEDGKNFRVKHQFKTSGSFDVAMKIVDMQGKVYESTTTVLVNPKPKADFDYETTNFQCHNSSICFRTNNTYKTKWNFGDARTSMESNPKHTYFRKGHYNVRLTVENEYGCKDSTQKQVYVMRAYNLLAPNSFSPNGDGVNDTWMPIALQSGDKQFELKIIDASGRAVFTSNNANQVWDGNLGNGMAKKSDMFFWIAVVTDSTGTPNEYGGSILIAP